MSLRRALWLCAIVALLLTGCAGRRIVALEPGRPVDPAALKAALAAYNGVEGEVRAVGSVEWAGGARLDFGARAHIGVGARLDGVAGPISKVVFSAACREGQGCDVYLPEHNTVVSDAADRLTDWMTSLVMGRVAVLGQVRGAWSAGAGREVLALGRDGKDWQQVVFDSATGLPVRVLYGDEDEEASLEFVYSDFREVDGDYFPYRITLGGAEEGDELYFVITKYARTPSSDGRAYRLRLPEGVAMKTGDGGDLWERMGLFWFPKK